MQIRILIYWPMSRSYHPASAPEEVLRRPKRSDALSGQHDACTWRRASVRPRRHGLNDVWQSCSSHGRRRLTYHCARSAYTCRKLLRACSRRSFPRGKRSGGVHDAQVDRPPASSGRTTRSEPDAATSSAARRTTGIERTPTSPTRRDGRRCCEKLHRENRSRVELAGVATLEGYLYIEIPSARMFEGWK